MSNYQLDYTLSSKELYSALSAAKIVPKKGFGQVIRTVLLLIVMAIVGVNMTLDISYIKIGVVLEAVCVVLLLLIWLLPSIALRSANKTIETQLDMKIQVEPGVVSFDDGTTIKMGENGTVENYPNERIFMVSSTENPDQLYIIPYRVVDFEQFEDFKNTVMFDPNVKNNSSESSDESSDETEQTEEDPFQLSREDFEQIIGEQTSDNSEFDENVFVGLEESLFGEQQESIVDAQPIEQTEQAEQPIEQEQPAENVQSDSDEAEQPIEAVAQPVQAAVDSQPEQAETAEEDEAYQLKMEFIQPNVQETVITEDMFDENDAQQLPLWQDMSEDVVTDITPDMFENRPMVLPMDEPKPVETASQSNTLAAQDEMPISQPENDSQEAPEPINSQSYQAEVAQADDSVAQEAVEAEQIENQAVEEEPVEQASVEAVEVAETIEAVEDAESVETVDSVEVVEVTETIETVEPVEQSGGDDEQTLSDNLDIDTADDENEHPEDDDTEDENFDDSLGDLIDAYLI